MLRENHNNKNQCVSTTQQQSQHSVVRIVTSLGVARPKNRGSIPVARLYFFFFQNVQTSSGSHPISYSIDNGGTFFGDKAVRA